MNPNNNNDMNNSQSAPRPITGADVPLALKARYFGSGLVVGVFISEPIKGLVAKLTKQAESLVGSDVIAQAKSALGVKSEAKDDCCDDEKQECHGNA